MFTPSGFTLDSLSDLCASQTVIGSDIRKTSANATMGNHSQPAGTLMRFATTLPNKPPSNPSTAEINTALTVLICCQLFPRPPSRFLFIATSLKTIDFGVYKAGFIESIEPHITFPVHQA